jgi:hypothetical protein
VIRDLIRLAALLASASSLICDDKKVHRHQGLFLNRFQRRCILALLAFHNGKMDEVVGVLPHAKKKSNESFSFEDSLFQRARFIFG